MKKIMILMLSLAVLFSFAACDNSSNTPDDEQTTTSTELNATQIQLAADKINDLLTGADGIVAKFTASATTLSDKYAAPSTTSYTYTWEQKASAAMEGDTNVTVTINAEANKTGATSTQVTTVFKDYTMEFTTSVLDPYSGNYVTVAGTVGGPLVNTATIGLTDNVAKTIKVDNAWTGDYAVIVPTSASVTWNDDPIDSASLLACVAKPTDATGAVEALKTGYKTEKGYLDDVATDAEDDIKAFVSLLFNASADVATLTDSLDAYIADGAATNYTVGTDKATAYVEYKASADKNEVIVADGTVSIALAPNSTFRIDFESEGEVLNSAANFTAKKFTLSGDFIVSDTAKTDYTNFSKVTVSGLKGELTAGTIVKDASTIDSITGLTFDDYSTLSAAACPSAGTVTATDVTTAAGPAIEQNAAGDWVRTQLGEASVKFPLD